MNDLKLFEVEYRKKRVEYFKKHFAGKSIDKILNKIKKDTFKNMAALYLELTIIRDCINAVKEENIHNDKIKEDIIKTYVCLNSLCNKFEQIFESDFQKMVS